jgi:tRNA (guanine37-N1)-methyltransferase
LTADAFNGCLLSFPQFTRPAVYNGLEVPPVLLSGNHADIEKWRREQQIERTRRRRPDLLKGPETKP